MTFKDYMDSLPNLKEEEIKKIAEATCSHVASVYRWMNGTVTPPMVKQKIISDITGLSVDTLFPNFKNQTA